MEEARSSSKVGQNLVHVSQLVDFIQQSQSEWLKLMMYFLAFVRL